MRDSPPGESRDLPSWEQLRQMGPFEGMRRMDLFEGMRRMEEGRGHLGGWGDIVLSPWGRRRPDR